MGRTLAPRALNNRQQLFVENYFKYPTAGAAAEAAGYVAQPFQQAHRLLSIPKIKIAINQKKQSIDKITKPILDPKEIVLEIKNIAFNKSEDTGHRLKALDYLCKISKIYTHTINITHKVQNSEDLRNLSEDELMKIETQLLEDNEDNE